VSEVPTFNHGLKPLDYTIHENVLQLTGKNCTDEKAKFFTHDEVLEVAPAYRSATSRVYLFDLRKAVPDSVESCNEKVKLDIKDIVPSKMAYTYYSKNLTVHFPDSSLFDTLYLSVRRNEKSNNESIFIGDETVPLMHDVRVEWLPIQNYDSPKFAVYRVNDWGGFANLDARWDGGKVTFSTREFGEFVILPDSTPPGILKIACTSTYARFKITDNLSGIFSFEATINGDWVLMNYDHKTGILYSERLDKKKPFKGDFQLKVTDYAGNEKIYKQKIL
jgi:hypothetical protein